MTINLPIPIDNISVHNPSDIYKIMQRVLKSEDETDQNKEHFWTVSTNDQRNILSLELVALGTYNMVHASPADILSIPLQKQAQGIILIHNHPSGNLQPSQEDMDFTDMMIQASRIMRIRVLDHLIINLHSYLSLAETDRLADLEGSNKYIPPYDLEKMSFQGGWEEGIEEGEKKGIEKGRLEGKEEGLKEGREQIAKQMLAKGLDIELICEMTGLSKQRICSL